MDAFQIFRLRADDGAYEGLYLWSTDIAQLELLFNDARNTIPDCQVKEARRLPTGDIYRYWLIWKGGTNPASGAPTYDDTLWWAMRQLCQRGWEPIGSVYGLDDTRIHTFYELRRKEPADV